MQQQRHYQHPNAFVSPENEPQDELDKLFSQLRPIEPPPWLVARILAHLPIRQSSGRALPSQSTLWHEIDGLPLRDNLC